MPAAGRGTDPASRLQHQQGGQVYPQSLLQPVRKGEPRGTIATIYGEATIGIHSRERHTSRKRVVRAAGRSGRHLYHPGDHQQLHHEHAQLLCRAVQLAECIRSITTGRGRAGHYHPSAHCRSAGHPTTNRGCKHATGRERRSNHYLARPYHQRPRRDASRTERAPWTARLRAHFHACRLAPRSRGRPTATATRPDPHQQPLFQNLTVNGVAGLTVADIPNLSSQYVSVAGGSTIAGLTNFANASTSLFSASGPAYFGATATSNFGTDGSLTLAKALGVASGGTGWTNINSGSILFGNGSAAFATSSSLFWDNTNSRLDIGTTSPFTTLAVRGGGYFSGNLSAGSLSVVGTTYDVRSYGAKCDGITDDTTAINNTISAASAAGGGTIEFPAGTCVMDSAMAIPYTGSTNPVQEPLRLTGTASSPDSYLGNSQYGTSAPIGGTTLDLRYAGGDGTHVAKIDTRGAGSLQIDHLTIKSSGTDATTFIFTTNTSLNIHNDVFIGNPLCDRQTCTQTVIQLGATSPLSSTVGTNAATDGFQGYGTNITGNYFAHIKIAVGFGGSANGVNVSNNTVDSTSGSSDTQGAPYVFYGVGLGTGGNILFGGIVEMAGYPYAVSMISNGSTNQLNHIEGLGLYDESMVRRRWELFISTQTRHSTWSPRDLQTHCLAAHPILCKDRVLQATRPSMAEARALQPSPLQSTWVVMLEAMLVQHLRTASLSGRPAYQEKLWMSVLAPVHSLFA